MKASQIKLKTSLKPYPEYKDSGIDWIGKIPKDFNVITLNKVLDYEQPGPYIAESISRIEEEGMIQVLTAGKGLIIGYTDDKNGIFLKQLPVIIFDDFTTSKQFISGPFKVRSSAMKILKPRNFQKENLKYLYYCMKVLGFQPLEHNRHWISMYRHVYIPYPSYSNQEKIVRYLDEKTELIDQIAEKKKRLIELLKEKRTAIINQAVTKGLDPNADLVDSGIDWIGEIPKDWKVEKIKFIAPQRNQRILLDTLNNKNYVGLENVVSWTGRFVESENETQLESVVNIFEKGDVLFGKLRPYLAKVFTPSKDGVSSGELLSLIPDPKKIIQKFLFYRLISKDFIKLIDDSTYGTKMPRANWDFIGSQFIGFPLTSDQKNIVEYLDKKTEVVDQIINMAESSIGKLKELKSSLISNVVTGKVRIL